jgi:drug/metabolite transporter (DMT)-like permease
MITILVAIFLNAWIIIILKSYPKYRVTAFNAILVNYFTAGTESFIFASRNGVNINAYHFSWLPWAMLCGTIFISLLLIISKSTIANGLSATSVANKMSVVVPALTSIYLFNEDGSFSTYAAIFLAILAVYLATYQSKSSNETVTEKRNSLWMLFVIFIGSGILDTVVNYCQKTVLPEKMDSPLFLGCAFFTGGAIAICIATYRLIKKEFHFTWRDLIGGLCLGIPNFFSIYFIMKAIHEAILPSSVLFPIINIGVVLTTTFVGLFFFKEKLAWLNYLGVALSILAILLLGHIIAF